MSNALDTIKKAPLRQVATVKDLLWNDQAKQQLAMVAAKHMNPEQLMRVMANSIRTTPKLGQCEPLSFLGALMTCASLGLMPNTVMGHAYLIPFDNRRKNVTEVQVIIGYRGLIDLARRSGHIVSISANIHYSDDDLWEYEEGTEATLRHRPGPQEGQKLHAYAIAKLKDGGNAYVVLPWRHVMKIRDGSQGWQTAVKFNAKDKSPWHTHEDAMAMKTAIRALSKYLPLSVEFMDAATVDEKKADYRAFAMDPTSGITLDGEVEGEAEPEPQEQAKPAVEQAKPQPVTAPVQEVITADGEVVDAKPEPARKSEPEPAKEQIRQGEAAKPHLVADADLTREPSQIERTADMIIKDLMDGGTADDVLELYGEAIDRIEDDLPAQYRKIRELMDRTRRG